MDVRCISDSGTLYPFQGRVHMSISDPTGTLYPFQDHTSFCFPQLLEYAAFEVNCHKVNSEERKFAVFR